VSGVSKRSSCHTARPAWGEEWEKIPRDWTVGMLARTPCLVHMHRDLLLVNARDALQSSRRKFARFYHKQRSAWGLMMAAMALLFSLVKVFGATRAKLDQAQLAYIAKIICNKIC